MVINSCQFYCSPLLKQIPHLSVSGVIFRLFYCIWYKNTFPHAIGYCFSGRHKTMRKKKNHLIGNIMFQISRTIFFKLFFLCTIFMIKHYIRELHQRKKLGPVFNFVEFYMKNILTI